MAKASGRLGKGLSALLADEDVPAKAQSEAPPETGKAGKTGGSAAAVAAGAGESEVFIPIDKLTANPAQPRKAFDDAELAELAASIKQHGVIQPIIVDKPKSGEGDGYIIVAGERRCRAARLAGLKEVPAIVRSYSSQKRLEIALVENIHRADLNPVEEAAAYKQLMETGGLTQDEAAQRLGKNRATVANALRLLKLPQTMRAALEDGSLSAGHARAILSLAKQADQEKLFAEITAKALSVRAAEQRAAELAGPAKKTGKGEFTVVNTPNRDPQLKAIEEKFIEKLGTKVSINGDLKKGRIEIEYYSMEDLDRLYGLLTGC
jgi:ParB family chromosome partitioning protein